MTRKTVEITIEAEGRDKGKTYVITEMAARKAEKWAGRAIVLLANGAGAAMAARVPDESTGWAGLLGVGLSALGAVPWSSLDPLLDEMLTCLEFKSQSGAKRPLFAGGSEDDVEEVATLIQLRQAAIDLHSGFSLADALSRLRRAMPVTASSPSTATSPEASAS